jgi:hypothetical protein
MWPFKKDPCVREGQWVGRKYAFTEVHTWDIKPDITAYELAKLTEATHPSTATCNNQVIYQKKCVPHYCLSSLDQNVKRHLRLLTREEYDKLYNPAMEYDQDA